MSDARDSIPVARPTDRTSLPIKVRALTGPAKKSRGDKRACRSRCVINESRTSDRKREKNAPPRWKRYPEELSARLENHRRYLITAGIIDCRKNRFARSSSRLNNPKLCRSRRHSGSILVRQETDSAFEMSSPPGEVESRCSIHAREPIVVNGERRRERQKRKARIMQVDRVLRGERAVEFVKSQCRARVEGGRGNATFKGHRTWEHRRFLFIGSPLEDLPVFCVGEHTRRREEAA